MSKPREFLDKDRNIAMKYYDLCEYDRSTKKALTILKRELKYLISEDPYFLDSYSDYYQILMNENSFIEARVIINRAYKNALKLILDENKKWPDSLEWGFIENRHIIRAILNKAIDEWSAENETVALDLFRNLLKTNPRDNAGVRFYILAILMGMSFEKYENKFNKDGYYDSSSWEWFAKNSNKFEDEFPSVD